SSATVRLSAPNGPHTTFRVFGSPYSPHRSTALDARLWAFGYEGDAAAVINKGKGDDDSASIENGDSDERNEGTDGRWDGDIAPAAQALWSHIPLDTDVVVTHTPPRGLVDTLASGKAVGCQALTLALSRVRPRLAVCGHVHESRGAERVRWDPMTNR